MQAQCDPMPAFLGRKSLQKGHHRSVNLPLEHVRLVDSCRDSDQTDTWPVCTIARALQLKLKLNLPRGWDGHTGYAYQTLPLVDPN